MMSTQVQGYCDSLMELWCVSPEEFLGSAQWAGQGAWWSYQCQPLGNGHAARSICGGRLQQAPANWSELSRSPPSGEWLSGLPEASGHSGSLISGNSSPVFFFSSLDPLRVFRSSLQTLLLFCKEQGPLPLLSAPESRNISPSRRQRSLWPLHFGFFSCSFILFTWKFISTIMSYFNFYILQLYLSM